MSDCRPPDARAGGAPVPPLGSQVWRRRAPNLKARGLRHKARGLHLAGVPTSSQVANHRHLRARNAASRRPGRMAVAGDLRGKPPTGEGSAAELGETIARVSQAAPHKPSRARAGAGEGQSHRPFKKGRGATACPRGDESAATEPGSREGESSRAGQRRGRAGPTHPAEGDGARQHGAVARLCWRAGPPPAHPEGPGSRVRGSWAPPPLPPPRQRRQGDALHTNQGRPEVAAVGKAESVRRVRETRRSFIFRLEKWREPRPFFKLGLRRGGGCATSAAQAAPPPPRAPGRARPGPSTRGAARVLQRQRSLLAGPALPARPGPWFPARWRTSSQARGCAEPGLAGGGPGGGRRRGFRQARPRIPGDCKHGSQRYTTPLPPSPLAIRTRTPSQRGPE